MELGELMSYSANLADLARQTAIYVDKILKAPNPRFTCAATTKFELHQSKRKALGLTFTRDFQLIADEVIE